MTTARDLNKVHLRVISFVSVFVIGVAPAVHWLSAYLFPQLFPSFPVEILTVYVFVPFDIGLISYCYFKLVNTFLQDPSVPMTNSLLDYCIAIFKLWNSNENPLEDHRHDALKGIYLLVFMIPRLFVGTAYFLSVNTRGEPWFVFAFLWLNVLAQATAFVSGWIILVGLVAVVFDAVSKILRTLSERVLYVFSEQQQQQ